MITKKDSVAELFILHLMPGESYAESFDSICDRARPKFDGRPLNQRERTVLLELIQDLTEKGFVTARVCRESGVSLYGKRKKAISDFVGDRGA